MAGRKESSSGQSSMLKKGGPFLLNDSSADDLSHTLNDPTESHIKQGSTDQNSYTKQIGKRQSGNLENNNFNA